jgi:hypothetical protein
LLGGSDDQIVQGLKPGKSGRAGFGDRAMTGRSALHPALLLALALSVALLAPARPGAAAPPKLALFPFELVDSSLQGEKQGLDPADRARLAMIEDQLRTALAASDRYQLIETAPAADAIEAAGRLWSCNGCELAIARKLGADLALVGWVQKVSNLILNLNVVVRDVGTRAPVLAGSVDIRGDTDESWRHGMRYLIKHRLLPGSG